MYIKPGQNYKMSKTLKTSLALSRKFQDPHQKGEWKRAMIQAELAALVVPKREKRNDRPPQGNFAGTAPADE
jgi:hypothetical protein